MVNGRISRRSYVLVWLLCAVLTCLAIHSPHCDRCDGPLVASSASPAQAIHQQLEPPDTCNGICWCCGFHSLPQPFPALTLNDRVTAAAQPEPASPPSGLRLPIFRPP